MVKTTALYTVYRRRGYLGDAFDSRAFPLIVLKFANYAITTAETNERVAQCLIAPFVTAVALRLFHWKL